MKVLTFLSFHPTWIHSIRQCIATTSFSVLLGGVPFGNFRPSHGLRQGDPLSPFLFILGFEILSRLIMREEHLGSLHGIKMATLSPSISHLLFAVDIMFISRANAQETRSILHCLSTYSR